MSLRRGSPVWREAQGTDKVDVTKYCKFTIVGRQGHPGIAQLQRQYQISLIDSTRPATRSENRGRGRSRRWRRRAGCGGRDTGKEVAGVGQVLIAVAVAAA